MAGNGRQRSRSRGSVAAGPASRGGQKHVVVVESPAKARTIGEYLGAGYKVMATRGHVRDLPAKDGSVDPDDGFAMTYETGKRAARTLGAIAKALARADILVLATDPDREGEAIAWQVLSWLTERDAVGERLMVRVVFHEVTPAAVRRALVRPRAIDMDLVRAWQARRALDYLVGYGLSPVLWRKLPGCRSAGRVQSVALRLVCEREAEVEAFVERRYWTVEAEIALEDGARFRAELCGLDGNGIGEAGLASERMAMDAVERVRAGTFAVSSVERDTLRRQPLPPLTTATLQQEAARRLGFGIGETMALAQRLYEGVDLGDETAGLVTYMRTDSTAMATTAVVQARAIVRRAFGDAYAPAKPHVHRSRARHVQEAHEAIRPTDFERTPEDLAGRLDQAAVQLYGLIRDRALASQMPAARFNRVRLEIASEAGDIVLEARGSSLAFDGHLRVWRGDSCEEGEGDASGLPALEETEPLSVAVAHPQRQVTQPPPRYTEAGLVRRLDELGIGRPSTWAAILAVLRERDYAVLHQRRFVPTERGRVVTAFLEGLFGRWVEYGFTAAMETDLDRIADGRLGWRGMLKRFWDGFHPALEEAGTLERATIRKAVEDRLEGFLFGSGSGHRRCPSCGEGELELRLGRHGPFVGCAGYPECGYRRRLPAAGDEGYTGPRELGTDSESGLAVTLRRGPGGWYVQGGDAKNAAGAKPERMSLPTSMEPETVDLDVARRLLALPRIVGSHPDTGAPIRAGIGRYGPWLRHEDTYAAIPADEDVLAIGLNRAVALVTDKELRESRARGPKQVLRRLGRHPGDGAPVWLKTGHYGPFVAHRRRYAGVAQDLALDTLTLEQAVSLLDR